MFGSLYNQAVTQPEPKKQNIEIDYSMMSKEFLMKKLMLFNTLDVHDQINTVKNNLETICKDILNNDISYAPVLRNMRFIDIFSKVINSVPIDYQVQIAVNKLSYDYFTSENPDSEIKRMYLNMSKAVNLHYINQLVGLGLDENTASNLALCRFSSSNEKTNVKRLNFTIQCKDPIIMTDQMVVWIYEKLFSRIYDLFEATMFEVYTAQQQKDFGDDFMEIYGTVGLAVLIILNNMTSENIRKVLLAYSTSWEYSKYPMTRYSLHNLSGDYSRISRIVDIMTAEGYKIP